MAKRLLDDGIFSSPSLAQCSPRAQDAWPRFLLLADDFGCFDANPRVLLGRGWPLRSDVAEADISAWMDEYGRAGMLGFWSAGGRVYANFLNWHGEKGQQKRTEYHPITNRKGSKRRCPAPPPDLAGNLSELLSRQFPARENPSSRGSADVSRPLPAYVGAVPGVGAVPVPGAVEAPPVSTTPPPTPGKTTSTDGEDDEPLPDALDAIYGSHRGRDFPWGSNRAVVERELFDRASGNADEICRRLANALSVPRDKFPYFSGAPDLVRFWDHYAEPWATSARRFDPNQGIPTR